MSDERPPCLCGNPGEFKVYHTKTRLEHDQELKGVVCYDCYRRMIDTGTTFAQLTEERLNKENEHGK